MAPAAPFTIRQLYSRLPSDGATRYLRISNVASPLSHTDVCELFQITGSAQRSQLRWAHCCSLQRTDFVVEFADEDSARAALQHVKGVTFHDRRLIASFVAGLPETGAIEYDGHRFQSEPRLFYALPSQAESDIARRKQEAHAKITRLVAIPKPKHYWVEKEEAE